MKKSAEQECLTAQYDLSCMYYTGKGVLIDKLQDLKCLIKATENGYEQAIDKINNMHIILKSSYIFYVYTYKIFTINKIDFLTSN